MTASTHHEEDGPVPRPASPDQGTPSYDCEITLSRDRPATCTISPGDAVGIDRLTAWVTATEGSFVSLEDVR